MIYIMNEGKYWRVFEIFENKRSQNNLGVAIFLQPVIRTI